MKTLKSDDVIRIMREEWTAGLKRLAEKVDVVMNAKVDGDGKDPVISPDLKVKHKDSGLLYTVKSVGKNDVILLPPDGEQGHEFLIDKEEFENNYKLG